VRGYIETSTKPHYLTNTSKELKRGNRKECFDRDVCQPLESAIISPSLRFYLEFAPILIFDFERTI
jgi:hypothetical protein